MSSAVERSDRGLDLSFATSFFVTAAVAVAPAFVAFGFLVWSRPDAHPFAATVASILLTAGAFALGNKVWQSQPESNGYSFADLMLWHWVRREWAEEKLVRNARLLGYDRHGRFIGKADLSTDRQLQAAREIGAALDAKSAYTVNHSKRIEKHARDVAAELNLSQEFTEELATAAALHDIGNLRIPESVARKTGELTREEWSTIQGHTLLGAIMAFEAGGEGVVQGVRHHHERYDGKGYPSGLKGEDIPLYARIIGIAEAYDAMTSTRPYRQSLTRDQAVAVLRKEAGSQFDPELVEVFVKTLPEPLAVVERFPFLAWAQRQLHELSLLFRRVGAVAISAAASTIAIALILGTAVLAPNTFGGRQGSGSVTPDERVIAEAGNKVEDRVLAERIALAAATDAGVLSDGLAANDNHRNGWTVDVEVQGERIADNGKDDDDAVDPSDDDGDDDDNGNGNGRGRGGDDPGRPSVIVDDNNGGGGGGGGGSNQPDPAPSTINPSPEVNDPGPSADRPGKSENAPGHTKDRGDKGKSSSAPGHTGEKGKPDDKGKPADAGKPDDKGKPADTGKPDDTGAPGNSDNAPGHSDAGSSDAPGNSGDAPGQDKKDGWAESASNEGNGNSDSGSSDGPGNSGSSNAGGNSDSGSSDGPGNSGSSNAGGNSDSGGTSSSGSSDGPGNSENSNAGGNGNGNGNGNDSGAGTES